MTVINVMMKLVMIVFFLHIGFSFLPETAADPNLYLVKLTDPDALCLDGSPAAYYISKGGDPKKIYLGFEGGGWCTGHNSVSQTIENCYQRSKGDLGSSTNYPDHIKATDGVLSTNEQNNFKDWTRVLIRYCDGSGHQGTKRTPVNYKGTNLYFRGHNITVAQLNSLEKVNKLFSEATQVVVGGASAGGLAVFLWTNYIKERVKVGKVWALPDCGIFLDSQNYATGKHDYKNMFKNLMSITNVEIDPPVHQCADKFKGEIQNCMFAVNLAPYIKTPLFVIESLYDTWSVPNILGISCIRGGSLAYCTADQKNHIEEYHRNTTNAIFEMTANNKNGFFAPACAQHVYGWGGDYYGSNFRIPQKSQNSISKTVESWLNDNADSSSYRRIDLGKWPDNVPCAGEINPSLMQSEQ